MCTGIEKNILEKINIGIRVLKINSYIDCIIKKDKMSEQEKMELQLLAFLLIQEMNSVQFVFLPEVLKFEDSIIRLN